MSVYNNFVMLEGNIGRDPELRENEKGHYSLFSLAVKRGGKGVDTTDWFDCIANHDIARGVTNINKGTRVIVIGSLLTYEKEGVKKYTIQAREIGLDVAVKKEGGNEELSEDSPF